LLAIHFPRLDSDVLHFLQQFNARGGGKLNAVFGIPAHDLDLAHNPGLKRRFAWEIRSRIKIMSTSTKKTPGTLTVFPAL
jgi:hypothetical protein